MEKHTNKHMPLIKNYLNQCYTDVLQNIRGYIGSSYIFFSVNKTTESRGKYVANFIVGELNADSLSKFYLLTSKVLEKNNNSTIAQFVTIILNYRGPKVTMMIKFCLMLLFI